MVRRLFQPSEEAGFALVDLLVAVAVAGLAGSILVGLVAFLERQGGEMARRTREHEGLLALERVLRMLVAESPPFLPAAAPRSAIFGDEREVSVVSTGPPMLGLPKVTAFTMHLDGQDPPAVILAWRDEDGREQRETVVEAAPEVAFAYLPHAAGSTQAVWRSVWRAEDGPVSALRFSLRSSDRSPRWVVIPIQADLPATCLRDPRQRGCAPGSGGR